MTWNYKGYGETSPMYHQNDWNQTLLTAINQASAQIHHDSLAAGGNIIQLHPSLMPLISTLLYYKPEMETLTKYKVVVDHTMEENKIKVSHSSAHKFTETITILNYSNVG